MKISTGIGLRLSPALSHPGSSSLEGLLSRLVSATFCAEGPGDRFTFEGDRPGEDFRLGFLGGDEDPRLKRSFQEEGEVGV